MVFATVMKWSYCACHLVYNTTAQLSLFCSGVLFYTESTSLSDKLFVMWNIFILLLRTINYQNKIYILSKMSRITQICAVRMTSALSQLYNLLNNSYWNTEIKLLFIFHQVILYYKLKSNICGFWDIIS